MRHNWGQVHVTKAVSQSTINNLHRASSLLTTTMEDARPICLIVIMTCTFFNAHFLTSFANSWEQREKRHTKIGCSAKIEGPFATVYVGLGPPTIDCNSASHLQLLEHAWLHRYGMFHVFEGPCLLYSMRPQAGRRGHQQQLLLWSIWTMFCWRNGHTKTGCSDKNRYSFARVSAGLGPPTIDCNSASHLRLPGACLAA